MCKFLLASFPGKTLVVDKRVKSGCSQRRPDVLLDVWSHAVVVEIDENQHIDYACSCENKRPVELWPDLGKRPVIFIRFNPDAYYDAEGKKIRSCWASRQRVPSVIDEADWKRRLECLRSRIEYWSANSPAKAIVVVQLLYDMISSHH